MKPAIVSAIKAFICRRSSSLTSLSLSWFGGEPLLANDVIQDIGSFAFNECQGNGIHFSGGLTTNGYKLTTETFVRLNEISHSNFQITLDGTEKQHNTTRVRADGEGTFATIWGNLVSIQNSPLQFHVTLRVHVSKVNLGDIRVLCKMIAKQFGGDERFSVHFHRISDLGGAGFSEEISMLEYREALTELKSLVGVNSASEVALIDSKEICYAAKINSLLIRADGRIGKCTVALEDDRNTVGRILEDGSLEIDNQKLRVWMNGFRDMDEQSLGCPLSNLDSRVPITNAKASSDHRRIPTTLGI